MNSSEQLKLDIISKLKLKKITKKQACLILNVSERTIERYLEKYNEQGIRFTIHGNKNKVPKNKTSNNLKEEVIKLVREKYYDFNMTHCLEKLKDDHNITLDREVFRIWCHEINLVKRAHKRRSSRVRRRRERMARPGVMLQMDGSPHQWFGGKESCLIATIDDANNEVAYGEFFPAEDTISCMTVLQNVIEKKGVFDILYTDKAGIFGGPKRVHFSQVKRALKELGIEIIFANSAEAKGRIERLWNTLQDRLIPEMRLRKIKSYHAANNFLQEQYLPNEYARKFTVQPESIEVAYRVVPEGLDLKEVFCLKEYRLVKKDHTLSWNGDTYDVKSFLKYSIYNQKIEIRTYQDLTWKAFFAGKEIEILKVDPVKRKTEVKQSPKTEQINGVIVRKDSHAVYKNHYYSVSSDYIGKKILVLEKLDLVYLYFEGKVIEVHTVITDPTRINSTKKEHMGPWENALKENSFYRKIARRVGVSVEEFIVVLIQRGQGFIDTKNIFGIISLQKNYTSEELNEVCRTAIEIESVSYRTVRSLLNLKNKIRKEVMYKAKS